MKNLVYMLASSLMLSVTGCSDFFDIEDKTIISDKIFPTTIDQIDMMLTTAYYGSHANGLYGQYWFNCGIMMWDHTTDVDNTYDDRGQLLLENASSDNSYVRRQYSDIMKWVGKSNEVLDAIDNYKADNEVSESDAAKLDYIRGQALFNRALAYWHGQIFFEIESKPGGLGLPLYERSPVDVDDMMAPRSTTAESWEFVVKTLQEAVTLLTGHTDDPTRATEWAAKGLLAKVYMQARQPQQARPLLEDIIRNSGKKLVSFEDYSKMFYVSTVWGNKYEFNEESLYELDMTTNWSGGPRNNKTGSSMQMIMAPWVLDLDIVVKAAEADDSDPRTSTAGGWGNNYVADANLVRFGFSLGGPGKRIANPGYDPDKERSIDNFPIIVRPEYVAQSLHVRENRIADPRLYVSAAQTYIDLHPDSKGRVTWVDKPQSMYAEVPDKLAWSFKKYMNMDGLESQINYSSPANFYIIRLADIYLLYAEVMKDTDPAVALEYINKVHRRAYGYPVDSPSPVDYRTLSDETKAPAEDHLHTDPLKYERWAELFAEGQWWWDVRRWEIGEQEMRFYKETRAGQLTWRGIDCYVQPIPQREIERYPQGVLIQSGDY